LGSNFTRGLYLYQDLDHLESTSTTIGEGVKIEVWNRYEQ
jgi:hypothetical protein